MFRRKIGAQTWKFPCTFGLGNNLFAVDFCANLDETKADMVQFTKSYKCEFCIFKAGLSSQVHMQHEPDASDPNQNVEIT